MSQWPYHGRNRAMAIERKNTFHLLLSDDELKLLRLLAEREGLNASDYLRSVLRRMAGPSPSVVVGTPSIVSRRCLSPSLLPA